ncbi:MAG: hypothetical protein IPM57_11155 [Oligoflexia bacterium]|nr:hypothetical protein [Oligoflexia bacterium]
MSIFKKHIKSKKYFLLLILFMVMACASTTKNSNMNKFVIGKHTTADITKMLGAPAEVSKNNKEIIYYYYKPGTKHQLYNIYFNLENKLTSVMWMPYELDVKKEFPQANFVEEKKLKLTPGLIEEEKTLVDKKNGISVYYLNNKLEAVLKYGSEKRAAASKQ